MTTPLPASVDPTEADESGIVGYLREHPEFFERHPYLLRELRIPHESGSAVSLVERQLGLFRQQRDVLEQQLRQLIETARQNDRFFEKSKRLLLNLIEAQTLEEVMIVLQESFIEDFRVDYCSLTLFSEQFETATPAPGIVLTTETEGRRLLGDLLDHHKAVCGRMTLEKAQLLFPDCHASVASAALVPLRHRNLLGILSIGCKDEAYFDGSMGSLFLSYISESLSRILSLLLARKDGVVSSRSEELPS